MCIRWSLTCGLFWRADNVYGVLPPSGVRTASIVLMLIHQIVAYALCALSPPTVAATLICFVGAFMCWHQSSSVARFCLPKQHGKCNKCNFV